MTREEIIKGLNDLHAVACGLDDSQCYVNGIGIRQLRALIDDATALLKAQEPDEDWISRKRLRDEIYYYIEEAGWGDEVNKVLGWCLEFIDNQRAVTWNDA